MGGTSQCVNAISSLSNISLFYDFVKPFSSTGVQTIGKRGVVCLVAGTAQGGNPARIQE